MHLSAKHRFVLAGMLVCLALAAGAALAGKDLTSGRYLQADNGAHIVIDRRGEPIVLRDRSSGEAMFDGLDTGDRVLVLHDAASQVYPARAGAYLCLRLGGGGAGDLPRDALDQLAELGWLAEDFLYL